MKIQLITALVVAGVLGTAATAMAVNADTVVSPAPVTVVSTDAPTPDPLVTPVATPDPMVTPVPVPSPDPSIAPTPDPTMTPEASELSESANDDGPGHVDALGEFETSNAVDASGEVETHHVEGNQEDSGTGR